MESRRAGIQPKPSTKKGGPMGVILRALAASKYVLLALLGAVSLLVVVSTTSSRTEAQDQGSRQAVGESRGANVVSSEISTKKQADAKEYWTPERMRNAKPSDMTLPGSPDSSGAKVAQPEGRPVMIPGAPPGGGSTTGASATPTRSIEPKATTSNGYTYPFPFTRYEVQDPGSTSYEAYPYKTNGKVFYTNNAGENKACSGTVVETRGATGPGNRSLIWTAGHCVSDGKGHFHTNWVFVPAYRDNTTPFGTWSSRQKTTKAGWHNFGNLEMDLGAVVVNTQSGKTIQDRVGSQGISFNKPYPQHWHAFGYPGNPPFDGKRLIACSASYATQGDPSNRTNVPTIGIGCDATKGGSGGGFIERWSFGAGFVNSVNSYSRNDQPLAIYGPYHGQAALDLYNHARTL
jgi:hypothetical protein